MKEYCRKKHISISRLSELTGIPYSTLNDIVNGKTDMDNVRYGYVKSIAKALNISLDELEGLMGGYRAINCDYMITVRNKSYYLEFEGRKTYLCKVNELNSYYIDELARWQYDMQKQEKMLSEWAK